MMRKLALEVWWHAHLARDSRAGRPCHLALALLLLVSGAAAGLAANQESPQKSSQDSPRQPYSVFVVISTDEEYVLLNFLGLGPTGQSLITQNNHSFDRMTALNPKTNETVVYFFNIDKPFNWLGQSLKK
jgi:hypothetical protein